MELLEHFFTHLPVEKILECIELENNTVAIVNRTALSANRVLKLTHTQRPRAPSSAFELPGMAHY